jgi:hypothetical protein
MSHRYTAGVETGSEAYTSSYLKDPEDAVVRNIAAIV